MLHSVSGVLAFLTLTVVPLVLVLGLLYARRTMPQVARAYSARTTASVTAVQLSVSGSPVPSVTYAATFTYRDGAGQQHTLIDHVPWYAGRPGTGQTREVAYIPDLPSAGTFTSDLRVPLRLLALPCALIAFALTVGIATW
ncbi:hypothetical protein [Kineococcus sp. SYSU DK005]|uniref:hypothetical protein n=1 Tax=Kineococcus sp. SYSU DK005 TaxID=3383126 RepID=UPI003D7EF2CD